MISLEQDPWYGKVVLSLSVILLILSIFSTYFLIWRKRKSFYLFLRFNFNGTSTSFDNVILNSVIANQDNASVTVLFRANWIDWVNATNLELISNQKRIIIEPSEVTEIRNRDVKPFKLGLVLI